MSNQHKKTALITGAGSGIGRATALGFAAKGCNIAVSDINEKGGKKTVELIEKMGGNAIFIACDVANKLAVQKMVKRPSNF